MGRTYSSQYGTCTGECIALLESLAGGGSALGLLSVVDECCCVSMVSYFWGRSSLLQCVWHLLAEEACLKMLFDLCIHSGQMMPDWCM